MHPWNGYNGAAQPQYPQYPPQMYGYPTAQPYTRPPPQYGGVPQQNQGYHRSGYGSYYQGRPYQSWDPTPHPRPLDYPPKQPPETPPINKSESMDSSLIDKADPKRIKSAPATITLDAPDRTVAKTEITVQDESDVIPVDIKSEDKKKVIPLVNLCDDAETPEERLNRFRFETRTKILQQLCGCQDESLFIMALRQFKEVLESQNGEIKMKYELMNLLGKYLPFLAKNYKVIGTSCVDEYLAIMEDVLVIYCNLVRDFINVQIERKKKRNLSRLAARIRYLMTICLLYRMDSILHCLFKVQLYPAEVEHSRMWTYIFVYFLKRAKYSHQNADYLRCFIGWQKVKTIRGNTAADEIDGVMYTRFNKSMADLKDLRITCLSEIIESMENDPRYCVRDMIRRYWRWWNVERFKDFLADIEEATTLILPGEIEVDHKEIFVEQPEIDPITQLFQEKRIRKRVDLTQIALNLNKEAEAGEYNIDFIDGPQLNCLSDDIPGPIILGDAVTIEDEPDDLLIIPPKVTDTVIIDSDEEVTDDDVIFVEEPKTTPAPEPMAVQSIQQEPEVSLLSPEPAATTVQDVIKETEIEPEAEKPATPTPPPAEEIPETTKDPEQAEPSSAVRSLFGDLTEEDLDLEDTFHMDFTAEDSDRLPDIPDGLVLPKAENLFGDSDDEWSNLDMNSVLNSIGESPIDCHFDDRNDSGAGLVADGVKVEKESPKKEKVSGSQESAPSTEQAGAPSTDPSDRTPVTNPSQTQTESQTDLTEPLGSLEIADNAESATFNNAKNRESSEETPTDETNNHVMAESPTSPEKTIIDRGESVKVNGQIENVVVNKEKQTLVIQLEHLSEAILRHDGKEIGNLWSCASNDDEASSKKMPDDIDDLQQMYLRGRHTDKSRHSSCSIEAPLFESLDKNEVRQFFDENLSKTATTTPSTPSPSISATNVSRPETPAPPTEVGGTIQRDPRLEGGTETAKRFQRAKAILSPEHLIRQTWSEAIADAMAVSQGAESYEEFICREGALIADQTQTHAASSDVRPLVHLWTNFAPDVAAVPEVIELETSADGRDETIIVQCRTILADMKREESIDSGGFDLDSSAHQLTPDWGSDDRHYASASTVTSTYDPSLVVQPSPPYSRENSPNDVGESAIGGNASSPMLYSPLLKDTRAIRSFYISDIVPEDAPRVPNSPVPNNNNLPQASPKQNSVNILEQVSKQFYATEFQGDLNGYVNKKEENLPHTQPPKNKPSSTQTSTSTKPPKTTAKSPIRPHITAEAELFLPSGPATATVTGASPAAPVWTSRDSSAPVSTSRIDPHPHPYNNNNNKNKHAQRRSKVNGTDLTHGRKREVDNGEVGKYKNPAQLDVKFLSNVRGEEHLMKQQELLDYSLSNFVLNQPANLFYPNSLYQPELLLPVQDPVKKDEQEVALTLASLPRAALRDGSVPQIDNKPLFLPYESFNSQEVRLPDVSTLRDPRKSYTQPVADSEHHSSLTVERPADSDQKLPLPPKKRKMTEDEEIAYILQRIRDEKEEREKCTKNNKESDNISYPAQRQMSIADLQRDFPKVKTLAARKLYPERDSYQYHPPPDFDEYRRFRDKQQSIMNVYINGVGNMGEMRDCGGNNYPVCLMINAMPPCVHHQNLVNNGAEQNQPEPQPLIQPQSPAVATLPSFPVQQQQQRYLPPQVVQEVKGRRGRKTVASQGGSPPAAKRGRGRPRKNPPPPP